MAPKEVTSFQCEQTLSAVMMRVEEEGTLTDLFSDAKKMFS